MSNSFTSENHIKTTINVLSPYQNNSCATLKNEEPEIAIILRTTILRIFNIRKARNENKIALTRLLKLIFGVDRLRMRRREYAEPAMHAPMISIGTSPSINIVVLVNNTAS